MSFGPWSTGPSSRRWTCGSPRRARAKRRNGTASWSATARTLRCIAAEALAPLCSETGMLKKGCLIQLKQWRVTSIQTRAVIVLLDVEVVCGRWRRSARR